ncbi:MAG: hypothetical protein WBC13_15615, partial [Dokdonella sp.]
MKTLASALLPCFGNTRTQRIKPALIIPKRGAFFGRERAGMFAEEISPPHFKAGGCAALIHPTKAPSAVVG